MCPRVSSPSACSSLACRARLRGRRSGTTTTSTRDAAASRPASAQRPSAASRKPSASSPSPALNEQTYGLRVRRLLPLLLPGRSATCALGDLNTAHALLQHRGEAGRHQEARTLYKDLLRLRAEAEKRADAEKQDAERRAGAADRGGRRLSARRDEPAEGAALRRGPALAGPGPEGRAEQPRPRHPAARSATLRTRSRPSEKKERPSRGRATAHRAGASPRAAGSSTTASRPRPASASTRCWPSTRRTSRGQRRQARRPRSASWPRPRARSAEAAFQRRQGPLRGGPVRGGAEPPDRRRRRSRQRRGARAPGEGPDVTLGRMRAQQDLRVRIDDRAGRRPSGCSAERKYAEALVQLDGVLAARPRQRARAGAPATTRAAHDGRGALRPVSSRTSRRS